MMHKSNIAIYGGSFDPLHFGHVDTVLMLLNQSYIDKVVVMPCYKQKGKHFSFLFETRIKLAQKVFSDISENIIVSDFEFRFNPESITYKTLIEYKKQFNYNLRFVIGSDLLNSFFSWEKYELIAKEAPLIIMERPGYQLLGSLDKNLEKLEPYNYDCLSGNINVSSTEIQNLLEEGKFDRIKSLVPRQVALELYGN